MSIDQVNPGEQDPFFKRSLEKGIIPPVTDADLGESRVAPTSAGDDREAFVLDCENIHIAPRMVTDPHTGIRRSIFSMYYDPGHAYDLDAGEPLSETFANLCSDKPWVPAVDQSDPEAHLPAHLRKPFLEDRQLVDPTTPCVDERSLVDYLREYPRPQVFGGAADASDLTSTDDESGVTEVLQTTYQNLLPKDLSDAKKGLPGRDFTVPAYLKPGPQITVYDEYGKPYQMTWAQYFKKALVEMGLEPNPHVEHKSDDPINPQTSIRTESSSAGFFPRGPRGGFRPEDEERRKADDKKKK